MLNKKRIISILTLVIFIFLVACTSSYTLSEEFHSKVVGVTFENGDGVNRQDILPELKSGYKLELKLEPQNPYDENAVEVYSEEGKIGYIKKELAAYISTLLEEDAKVEVKVSQITGGGSGINYGCNIIISVYERN